MDIEYFDIGIQCIEDTGYFGIHTNNMHSFLISDGYTLDFLD